MDILKRIDFVQQFAKECADGSWSIETENWRSHVTPEFIEDVRQYIVSLQLKLMHEQTKQARLKGEMKDVCSFVSFSFPVRESFSLT